MPVGSWKGSGSRAAVRTHPEDDLQKAIVDLHRTYIHPDDAILFAVPNGEKRDPVTAARLTGISSARREEMTDVDALRPYGQGVLPGVTDLVLVLPFGRTVWIEVKIPKITFPPMNLPCTGKRQVLHEAGVLSKDQKRFMNGICAMQHEHRLVRSCEDYMAVLEAFGVPFRRGRPWGPGFGPLPPQAAS